MHTETTMRYSHRKIRCRSIRHPKNWAAMPIVDGILSKHKRTLCPFSIDRHCVICYSLVSIPKFLFSRDFLSTVFVMDDLQKFYCPNKKCSAFGIRGGENIRVKDTYGQHNTRLLQCKECKQRFSEHRGTIFFDSRLPKDKVVSIVEHVVEGNGMRKTGRLLNVDADTVKPSYRPPKELVYATVCKRRVKGRVNKIEIRTVFGTAEQVAQALKLSKCSRRVNTSFIERQNGTDRNRCSRKVRKSYCFSKDWNVHRAATCLTMYSYNFCWAVRTLTDSKSAHCHRDKKRR